LPIAIFISLSGVVGVVDASVAVAILSPYP